MNIVVAKYIGAIVHWLLKGCRTKLSDEINGYPTATWGGSYDMENVIIGYFTIIIVFGLIIWIAFG
jgi:hypothetical protein